MCFLHHLRGIQSEVAALSRRSRELGLRSIAQFALRPRSTSSLACRDQSEHEHFFRYTSGRWIYNEQEQMRIRYMPFNVDALKQVATTAAGANYCVEIVKAAEGAFNKIFLLTFDNGKKLVAKIPCPVSVPRRLCTASEVATMDYARNIMGIPVPQVLSWNSDADASEVGAEYIIMEHVEGVEWRHRRENLTTRFTEFIDQLIDIDFKFTGRRFSQIGSIYYKEDLSPALQQRPLYADGEQAEDGSDRFRIGPYVEWNFWRGRRSELDVDRGPWSDTLSYIKATIEVEKQWLSKFAVPRGPDDIFRRSDSDNSPEAHIALLDKFLAVVPSILPPDEFCAPVLWHHDLHAGNIFIAPEGKPDIQGIIDWQGASIRPLFLQPSFAPCVQYNGDDRIILLPGVRLPLLPPDFDSYSAEEQSYLKIQHRLALQHKYYAVMVMKQNPLFFEAQSRPNIEHVIPNIHYASQTWDEGIHHLRQGLLELESVWEEFSPSTPFPISWDPKEIAEHKEEYPKQMVYENELQIVVKALELEGDGGVTNERYEEVKRRSDELCEAWPAEEFGGPYPFQDGARSFFLS